MLCRRKLKSASPPFRTRRPLPCALQREGPSQFKFASNGRVDEHRLTHMIDRHLQSVLADKNDWPADAHQAERLVSQHVLMAISEYSNAGAGENAQPAGAHLHGQSTDTNATSGSSTGGTSSGGAAGTSTGGATGTSTGGASVPPAVPQPAARPLVDRRPADRQRVVPQPVARPAQAVRPVPVQGLIAGRHGSMELCMTKVPHS